MQRFTKTLGILIACIFILTCLQFTAQGKEDHDKSLSPFFIVQSDSPSVDQLPLQSTSAQINVAGVIADVTVRQVYKNEGQNPIEAIYVFPASTRAAVYGMKMSIGERTIVAQIQERGRARQEYEEAKTQGKSASLLEQHRPNVFQMNVANIMPADVITVELKYTELLIPTNGIYEVVYPTVVGPRYANKKQTTSAEQWVENPYLHEGEKPHYTFDLTVNLMAGLPIQDVVCTTHKTAIQYEGLSQARIKLDPSETDGGNRDFILRYRLTGKRIESGLLLFDGGEKENFFLCMIQPPRQVSKSQIPPREYIFIVDVSGSMHGFPLNISKRLFKDILSNLRPIDTFNVLLFAGSSFVMSEHSLPATALNIKKAITLIENQRGGGGTELLPALKRALALPETDEGSSRTIVIATDGYVRVEEEAFDLIRKNLDKANMFAFGIGSSVNRHIIEGMARVGMGEPFVITSPEQAGAKAEEFRRLIETPVLTNIEINFDTFQTYDCEPVSIPDVFAQRPVIIFGKWRGKPEGVITLTGISGEHTFRENIDVSKTKPSKANAGVQYLWARSRIAILADYNKLSHNDERIKEVTTIGLTYNLLTAYTSFIAVDTEVRQINGKTITVKHPLPLPQGVSDYAVGESFANRGKGKNICIPLALRALPAARDCYQKSGESLIRKEEEAKEGIRKKGFEIGTINISGSLQEKDVRQLLETHLQDINNCVKRLLQKKENLVGEIIITLVLDSKGVVAKAKIEKSDLQNKKVERCILKRIRKISFPAASIRADTMVTITLHLKQSIL